MTNNGNRRTRIKTSSSKRRVEYKKSSRYKKKRYRKRNNFLFVISTMFIMIIFFTIRSQAGKKVQAEEPTQNINSLENTISTETINTSIVKEEPITSKFKVFIDPGHGFSDPGTSAPKAITEQIGSKVVESKITLEMGLRLADIIKEKGFDVVLSRTEDYDTRQKNEMYKLSKQERAILANESKANLFISLHIDAFEDSASVNGYRIFYCVDKENLNEDKKAISDSIMKNFTSKTNIEKIKTIPMEDDKSYHVIKNTNMPSILFEMGFATNKDDAKRLSSKEWRNKVVDAIADGIFEYINMKLQ